jgi:outer membrane protein TolC
MGLALPGVLIPFLFLGAAADSTELTALRARSDGIRINEYVRQVLHTAPDIESATADLHVAKSRAWGAFLGFVPRVDLEARYNRLSEVDLPGFVVNGVEQENPFPQLLDSYDLRARVKVPLSEYFLTILPGYRLLHSRESVTRHQLQAQRANVALDAIHRFITWVRVRASMDVATDSAKRLEEHLADVRRLVQAGIATEVDELEIRSELASAQVEVERHRGMVELAQTRVTQLMEERTTLVNGENFLLEPVLNNADLNFENIVQRALDERPEMKALRELITLRRHDYSRNRGTLLPKLSLHGDANYSNPNQRIFPQTEEFRSTWSAGVSLEWSPNEYISNRSESIKADQEVVKANATLRSMEYHVTAEVSDALSAFKAAKGTVRAAGEGRAAALEGFAATEKLFAAGDIATRVLLDRQEALRRANLQLTSAHLDLHLAFYRLKHATGRLHSEGIVK